MSEWEVTTLGEVCKKVMTGGTPLSNNEDFYKDGTIPWLRTKEVNFCRIRETESYISEQGLANSAAKVIPPNSVIIAMYGQGDTAGRVAINEIPLTTNQACCNLVIDERIAEYNFVYFYLKNSYRELVNAKTGSAQPNLNTQIIKDFPITLPPLQEQKEISAVLVSLDRKIENLRRQNETLEAIAQTLFKHWFVDFEFPNEDGKFYKSSGGAIERSELGENPAGWRVGKLQDVVNVNAKSISNGYKHTNIEYVDISSVGIGSLEDTSSYRLKDAPSRAKRLVMHGDVIWSGVRPNRKSYLFISHPPENLVVSTGFITLTPILIPSSYLYSWVTTDSFVEYLTFNASGSAYPAVKAEHFEIADILLPEKPILNKFHAVVDPMREKIHQNALQIQTLTKARDVLLPKLMSGKLCITE